jgi:hypothetical protein
MNILFLYYSKNILFTYNILFYTRYDKPQLYKYTIILDMTIRSYINILFTYYRRKRCDDRG